MRWLTLALCASLALLAPPRAARAQAPGPAAQPRSSDSEDWNAYLDYAYVYSSADSQALKERLAEYAAEAGIPLRRYIEEYFETLAPLELAEEQVAIDETETRRKAVAYLLDYLATGRVESLDQASTTVRQLRVVYQNEFAVSVKS